MIKYRFLGALAILAGLFACQEDELSLIGESVQSKQDKVESSLRYVQFEAKTVRDNNLYRKHSTTSLLGEVYDPVYGDFKAEYLAKIRWASGFKFYKQPIDAKIDSAKLVLTFPKYIGNLDLPMNYAVYELEQGVQIDAHSKEDLAELCKEENLLGSIYASPKSLSKELGEKDEKIFQLYLPLKKELGQRFYDKSVQTPEVFNTQESFEKNVLAGLVVRSTTGRGSVIRVINTSLAIYYTYLDDKNEKKSTAEVFISSRLTGHTNGLKSSHIEELTAENDKYIYVKQPVGVMPELTLKKEQMQRLLDDIKEPLTLGKNWRLADAQMSFAIDNPKDLTLNPPTYMMLMPKDSVETFFSEEQTEQTRSLTSYLSTRYSVDNKAYNFNNIADLITLFLAEPQTEPLKDAQGNIVKNHLGQTVLKAKRDANGNVLYKNVTYTEGQGFTVNKDLVLNILPVERKMAGQGATASIYESLFPNFVRLDKSPEKLKVAIVAAKFKE